VIVVPDAGPLIYLAGSGHLELLPALYSQVVPRIVFDEIAGKQRPYLSLNVSELRYSRTTRGRGRWQGV